MAINGNNLQLQKPLEVSLVGNSFFISSGLVQVDGLTIPFNDKTLVEITGDSCLLGIEVSVNDAIKRINGESTPLSKLITYEDREPEEGEVISYISTDSQGIEIIQIQELKKENIKLTPKCKPLREGKNQITKETRFKALAYCHKNGKNYTIFPCMVNPLIFILKPDSNKSSLISIGNGTITTFGSIIDYPEIYFAGEILSIY